MLIEIVHTGDDEPRPMTSTLGDPEFFDELKEETERTQPVFARQVEIAQVDDDDKTYVITILDMDDEFKINVLLPSLDETTVWSLRRVRGKKTDGTTWINPDDPFDEDYHGEWGIDW